MVKNLDADGTVKQEVILTLHEEDVIGYGIAVYVDDTWLHGEELVDSQAIATKIARDTIERYAGDRESAEKLKHRTIVTEVRVVGVI